MLRVLTYHRVLESADATSANPALVSASRAGFDGQMRHLATHYRVVPAAAVLQAVRGEARLPPRAVLLTFDDGYRDFGTIVWPILRRYGLPATVFVPTAYPDQPALEFWWDRLYRALGTTRRSTLAVAQLGSLDLRTPAARRSALRALQRWLRTIPHAEALAAVDRICESLAVPRARPADAPAVLGWNELRRLAGEGVTVAAHSRTHPALTRMGPEEARREIRGSREDIGRELGAVPPIFSYPFGLYDDRVAAIVRDEGFELAVTCADGQNRAGATDPLRLRRTNITRRTSPFVFRLRLLRPVSYLDRWRHREHTHG